MEYDEAFWLLVDVVNLERHAGEAEATVNGAKAKVAKAKEHLEAAKSAEDEAKADLVAARQALADAKEKAAAIPAELAETAQADVTHRNAVRDAVVNAMAGVAQGKGEVRGTGDN